MRTVKISDDEITITDVSDKPPLTFAEFSGLDRIEGFIDETNLMVLSPSDLISLAKWLLDKAAERSEDLNYDAAMPTQPTIGE